MQGYSTFSVVIANGTALSNAVDLRGHIPCGIQMPAAWTSAGLSFEVSDDGISYADLYDDTAEYTLAAGAARAIGFPGDSVFSAFKYIKVRSGTTGTPVSQGAERIIKILTKSQ